MIYELVGKQPKLMAKVFINVISVSELLFWEVGDGRESPHFYIGPQQEETRVLSQKVLIPEESNTEKQN